MAYRQENLMTKTIQMNDFLDKFIEIFDDLDASQINLETEFRTLDGWDSITALSLIGMIDDEYGLTLNGSDMKKCVTIKDLIDTIKEKK